MELQSNRAVNPTANAVHTPEKRFTSHALLPMGNNWNNQDPMVQRGYPVG
jgi:hypothetical protein